MQEASAETSYLQYRTYDDYWNPEHRSGPDLLWHAELDVQSESIVEVRPFRIGEQNLLWVVSTDGTGASKVRFYIVLDDDSSRAGSGASLSSNLSNRFSNSQNLSLLPSLVFQSALAPEHRRRFADYRDELFVYDRTTGGILKFSLGIPSGTDPIIQSSKTINSHLGIPNLPVALTSITSVWTNSGPAYVLYRKPSAAHKGLLRVVRLDTRSKPQQWVTLWQPPMEATTTCVPRYRIDLASSLWRSSSRVGNVVTSPFYSVPRLTTKPSGFARICPPFYRTETRTVSEVGEVDEEWTHFLSMGLGVPGTALWGNEHLLAYDSQTGDAAVYEVNDDGSLRLGDVMRLTSGYDEVAFIDRSDSLESFILLYETSTGDAQSLIVDYDDDQVIVRADINIGPGLISIRPYLRGFLTVGVGLEAHPEAVCGGAPPLEQTLDSLYLPSGYRNFFRDHWDIDEPDWNDGFGYKTYETKRWRPYARTMHGLYVLYEISQSGLPGLNRYDWAREWVDYLTPGCDSAALAGTQQWWGYERIKLYKPFFYNLFPVERAAVLVHEAAHAHDLGGSHVSCPSHVECDQRYGGADAGAYTYHYNYVKALLATRHNPGSLGGRIELTTLMYRRLKSHLIEIGTAFVENPQDSIARAIQIDQEWH